MEVILLAPSLASIISVYDILSAKLIILKEKKAKIYAYIIV